MLLRNYYVYSEPYKYYYLHLVSRKKWIGYARSMGELGNPFRRPKGNKLPRIHGSSVLKRVL
jgi:hypothetical protein